MFNTLPRALAAAALLALTAQSASAATTQLTSSAAYWGQAGDHADMVLRYDSRAAVTLTILSENVVDLGGAGVSQQLNTCGTPVKTGDTVTSHQLAPGQFCYIRAHRSPSEFNGRFVISDPTGSTANIVSFVRAGIEVRDGSDNVLTHVEVR